MSPASYWRWPQVGGRGDALGNCRRHHELDLLGAGKKDYFYFSSCLYWENMLCLGLFFEKINWSKSFVQLGNFAAKKINDPFHEYIFQSKCTFIFSEYHISM